METTAPKAAYGEVQGSNPARQTYQAISGGRYSKLGHNHFPHTSMKLIIHNYPTAPPNTTS
jgi:hypothetical protein